MTSCCMYDAIIVAVRSCLFELLSVACFLFRFDLNIDINYVSLVSSALEFY